MKNIIKNITIVHYVFFFALMFVTPFLFPHQTQAVICTARLVDAQADAARNHKPVCQPGKTTRDECNAVCQVGNGTLWAGCQLYEIESCNDFEEIFDEQGGYQGLDEFDLCGVNGACPSQREGAGEERAAEPTPVIRSVYSPKPINLQNPLQGNPDVNTILGRIITAILGVIGSVTLVVFIYGGFLWLTSAGNDGQVKKGANTMLYAIIGLFIIFAAYAILNTIISALK